MSAPAPAGGPGLEPPPAWLAAIEARHPCDAGLAFARQHRELVQAWYACPELDWLCWLVRRFASPAAHLGHAADAAWKAYVAVFNDRALGELGPLYAAYTAADYEYRKAASAFGSALRRPKSCDEFRAEFACPNLDWYEAVLGARL